MGRLPWPFFLFVSAPEFGAPGFAAPLPVFGELGVAPSTCATAASIPVLGELGLAPSASAEGVVAASVLLAALVPPSPPLVVVPSFAAEPSAVTMPSKTS